MSLQSKTSITNTFFCFHHIRRIILRTRPPNQKFVTAALHIDLPNFIVCLTLGLEILGNMCIVIVYYPVCDVIKFEINHSFFLKRFFCITKKSGQNCNYLKNDRSFPVDTRRCFNVYKMSIGRRQRLIDVETTSCVYWILRGNKKHFSLILKGFPLSEILSDLRVEL